MSFFVYFTFFAPGRHSCPVTEEALRGVVALQHVAVPALELADHAVIQLRRNHHSVLGSFRQLRAFRWNILTQLALALFYGCLRLVILRKYDFAKLQNLKKGCDFDGFHVHVSDAKRRFTPRLGSLGRLKRWCSPSTNILDSKVTWQPTFPSNSTLTVDRFTTVSSTTTLDKSKLISTPVSTNLTTNLRTMMIIDDVSSFRARLQSFVTSLRTYLYTGLILFCKKKNSWNRQTGCQDHLKTEKLWRH